MNTENSSNIPPEINSVNPVTQFYIKNITPGSMG